jgi:hypothetical protein
MMCRTKRLSVVGGTLVTEGDGCVDMSCTANVDSKVPKF